MNKNFSRIEGVRVDHAIPIPPKRQHGGKWVNIIRSMKIGDSFLVKGKKQVSTICSTAKKRGYGMTARKLSSSGDRHRIWLIKVPVRVNPLHNKKSGGMNGEG